MRKKQNKAWAIRRHKTPTSFEYLGDRGIWGEREARRKFECRAIADKQAMAYVLVGVHARVVPYGD